MFIPNIRLGPKGSCSVMSWKLGSHTAPATHRTTLANAFVIGGGSDALEHY
jgi:hypothetical protein